MKEGWEFRPPEYLFAMFMVTADLILLAGVLKRHSNPTIHSPYPIVCAARL